MKRLLTLSASSVAVAGCAGTGCARELEELDFGVEELGFELDELDFTGVLLAAGTGIFTGKYDENRLQLLLLGPLHALIEYQILLPVILGLKLFTPAANVYSLASTSSESSYLVTSADGVLQ
ncbi:hypothetical protein [Cellvibrio fibrivorans]|uniref:Lipoprotein n=1 Tax=Cellvibrio fibrivorans TaxID=126350 RepID=A0ABU1V3S5_9GAMM|nr:hypothetical protein [Cellvibrio fibrivorans]MDR7091988.1 hypothetical protein [Cellvibrio fibrivorans]